MQAKRFIVSKENVELANVVEEMQNKASVEENLVNICHHIPCDHGIYTKDLTNDIELFDTFSGDDNNDTLFNQLKKYCSTQGGEKYMKNLLNSPLKHYSDLKKRQNCIKTVKDMSEKHLEILKNIKKNEDTFLWLFNEKEETVQDVYNLVYYRSIFTEWLNGNEHAITGVNIYTILVSPSIGILSPLTYFIFPYLVLYFKMGLKISFKSYLKMTFKTMFMSTSFLFGSNGGSLFDNFKYASYLFSLLFYFQSLFNSIEMSKTMYKIASMLTEKVNQIVEFIRDCKLIVDLYWEENIASDIFKCEIENNVPQSYFENVDVKTFNLFSNFGSRLKIFKNINPDDYVSLVQQLYMLDTIWAIKKKVLNDNFCFSTFEDSNDPVCKMLELYHPCLAYETVVKNDINFDSKTRNIIITGPNAGGKSTLIKSVLSNVLIAQTLTIGSCSQLKLTPFHLIHSQINIPDCKGKESLFEAEMNRSKRSIDMLNKCSGPSIIVMDEIFNSTNPIEGIAGAYAIAKKIGKCATNLTLISTHYLYLTKLVKEIDSFANYKMDVNVTDDSITFPYKLKKGICKQFIALELLKKNGFDDSLIEDAINIKEKLTKK